MTYRIVHNSRCVIGEGPLWWNDKLWFVDGFCNAVRTADPKTGEEEEYIDQGVVTSMNPMADGKLLLTRLEGCFEVLDPVTGKITPFAFDHQNRVLHFNDSKVGPDGCLYVGNRRDHPHIKGEINPDNGLYRLSPDGSFTKVAGDFIAINGLDWSPDGKILYVVSGQMALRKFVFGETLTEQNPIYLEGHPDGMTVDTEGYPICALWAPGKVVRVDPETGNTLETFQMPCCVSSCCFGGEDFRKLYVVTNAWSSDPVEMQDGRTYELTTHRQGQAPYVFGIPNQTR